MECCEWQLLSVPHDQAFTMSMVEEWCQQPHIPFDSISYHMLHLFIVAGIGNWTCSGHLNSTSSVDTDR